MSEANHARNTWTLTIFIFEDVVETNFLSSTVLGTGTPNDSARKK